MSEKEYDSIVVGVADIKQYLNTRAKEGYALLNMQPFSRKIRDTEDGTIEEVIAFQVTMERTRTIETRERKTDEPTTGNIE